MQDDLGRTALILFSSIGNFKLVEYLIKNGADVNIKNNEGKTALDLAKEKGHIKISEILKNADAKHGDEI